MNRLSREELVEASRLHLSEQGCTIWGRAWGLWDNDYEAAIEWLADEVVAVLDRLQDPLPAPSNDVPVNAASHLAWRYAGNDST